MNSLSLTANQINYFVLYSPIQETTAVSPLLLLHGFTGSHANWLPIINQLNPHIPYLAIDLLGHGHSPSPPNPARYTMPHAATDIINLLDQLNLPQINLLGYSMGGRLALYLAIHYPHRINTLILESSSPGLPTPTEQTARQQRDDALAQRILNQGLPAFVDFWENIPLFASQKQLPPSTQDHHRQLRLQNNPLGLANSLRGMGTGQQPNLWPHLPTLNLPTHLIAGALDTKFVNLNQQMHAQLPQSTLTIIPQVGHTTHLEAPHQYTNHIHALLLPPT